MCASPSCARVPRTVSGRLWAPGTLRAFATLAPGAPSASASPTFGSARVPWPRLTLATRGVLVRRRLRGFSGLPSPPSQPTRTL
eukprot:10635047-Alexandrium_andersonii.AAC.1